MAGRRAAAKKAAEANGTLGNDDDNEDTTNFQYIEEEPCEDAEEPCEDGPSGTIDQSARRRASALGADNSQQATMNNQTTSNPASPEAKAKEEER